MTMPTDDTNLDAELHALIAAGRKIEAIKRYRELTGVGLAEAKNAVEALMQGASLPSREPGEVPFEAEIISLLEQGKKIAAIKLYREKTGVGLKEAKDFIEALAVDRRIAVPSRSGCLGVVLFVAAVLVIVIAKSFAAEDRESALKQRYDAFVQKLDHRTLTEDYAGAVRNLDSTDPKKQIIGIKTLAATEELKAIPWIVPFLDSQDQHVRIYAGHRPGRQRRRAVRGSGAGRTPAGIILEHPRPCAAPGCLDRSEREDGLAGGALSAMTFLYTTHQDYWSGELVNLKAPAKARYLDNGLQWFGWTCIEDRAWVHHRLNTEIPKPLYSDEEIVAYVRTCNSHQAPMTFNVGVYQDGWMAEASVEQLRRLGQVLAPKAG